MAMALLMGPTSASPATDVDSKSLPPIDHIRPVKRRRTVYDVVVTANPMEGQEQEGRVVDEEGEEEEDTATALVTKARTRYGVVCGTQLRQQLCRDFTHGHCRRESCKFLHQIDGVEYNPQYQMFSHTNAVPSSPSPSPSPWVYTPYLNLASFAEYHQTYPSGLVNCSHPQCVYIHNVNRYCHSPPHVCQDFSTTTCSPENCPHFHNVNPNWVPGTPECAEFKIAFQNQMAAVNQQESSSVLQPQSPQLQPTIQSQPQRMIATSEFATAPPNSIINEVPVSAAGGSGGGGSGGRPKSVMRNGCSRQLCTYVHNANAFSPRGAPPCESYASCGTCYDQTCVNAHNVNPNAMATSPECHDFKNMIRRQVYSPIVDPSNSAGFYLYMNNNMVYGSSFAPGAGCGRANCTYIHNVNMKAPKHATPCGGFIAGSCLPAADCHFSHNVNPNAIKGSPQCGDFSREYKKRFNSPKSIANENAPGNKLVNLCADFQTSRCVREMCVYVHNINTNCSVGTKSRICSDFANRGCTRPKCSYFHNVNPRAGPSPYVSQQQQQQKREIGRSVD